MARNRIERRSRLKVSDNGPGLPEETLRLVFDPFALRSDTPLEYGIHLMACYFIVHHHGGRIAARSEEGEGTTFTAAPPHRIRPGFNRRKVSDNCCRRSN